MMEEEERYQRIDLPFYRSKIAPILPAEVLDFHAHAWKREHFYEIPWESGKRGGKYMVTETDYGIDQLMEDGKRIFADRPYNAVCFGYPSPVANHEASNNYLSTKSQKGIYPLMLITRDKMTYAQIKESIVEGGFFGFKVILPWIGNDYGNVRIQDMIGPTEMNMANNLGLVVLIHVPRSGRLANPEIQREVREYGPRRQDHRKMPHIFCSYPCPCRCLLKYPIA